MIVRDIVKMKGGAIFSIAPGDKVSEAVGMMVRHDVGSLVVMEDASMVGMLTFREVLRALEANRARYGELAVRDIMIREPACGSVEDSLESLREMMNKDHIRYLPVRDGEKLVGVISFHDVANAVIKELAFHNRLLKSYIKNWPEEESAK
ncbi:MAG TPA: CBS domain-containing protein [Burkholderiales bacterium]|nr:CBS domain-containing protein [Burkholderiales bacterium]